MVQITIHDPTEFLKSNIQKMIPHWDYWPFWVILILQPAKMDLMSQNSVIDSEKDRLRMQFIHVAKNGVKYIQHQGGEGNFFDPKTGYPYLGRPGTIPHDDVATVSSLLGYPTGGKPCRGVIHPHWGNAVYPGVMVSSVKVSDLVLQSWVEGLKQ